MNSQVDLNRLALDLKEKISEANLAFLKEERHLSDEVIDHFSLGQKGDRLSIPVCDSESRIIDIRLYLPPRQRKPRSQKVIGMKGVDGSAKLFPNSTLKLIELHALKTGIVESDETLGSLEALGPLYASIKDWTRLVLVEGELDALALLSQGYLAITNTCGAKAWTPEFTDLLAELNIPVVVALDNDFAGEEGAALRAAAFFNSGVSVTVIDWPLDRPSGHDVTDELSLKGRSSLEALLNRAPAYRDVVGLDEVCIEPLIWIFKPYIALRKVTMLEGDPGIGKTFLTLKIAASVSRGGLGLIGDTLPIDASVVLLMSAEDGLADTIRPRLEKMDADLTKILAPKDLFTLDDKGFATLYKMVERYRPKLVIVDPITPFLPSKSDSHKASDMRPFFKKLGKLASQYECAVVVTRHLAKSKELKGVSSGLGSIDISAAVRSILQVTEDPENKAVKKVSHVKSNLSCKGEPFGYSIQGGIFLWHEGIFAEGAETDEALGELENAQDFLYEMLNDGPKPALDVFKAANDQGIAKSTLKRAKTKMKVKSKRVTNGGATMVWEWYLPIQEAQESQGTQGDQEIQESLFRDDTED